MPWRTGVGKGGRMWEGGNVLLNMVVKKENVFPLSPALHCFE